jgi:hypothetical protein
MIKKHDEKQMCEEKVPTFDTIQELTVYIDDLANGEHDYGTCVYAMSMSAVAAYNFIARKLGVSGFQASCADMDVLARCRGLERFGIYDLRDLLYPQYREKFDGLAFDNAICNNAEWLKEEAQKLLTNSGGVTPHPSVLEHWQMLLDLEVEERDPEKDGDRHCYE